MNTAITISIIAILLTYLESKKIFKYGLVAGITLITVFVAIRYGWGTDLSSYLATFQLFSDSGYSVFDFNNLSQIRDSRSFELGWAILNVLFRPIGFFGLIIFLAVIEGLILYDVIKRYVDKEYYWLAIYIYTMNPYMMVLGCSMLRQWLSMFIILFAIRFIILGRFWIYSVFVLLAASFHASAILFILLYLFKYVRNYRFNKDNIWLVAFITIIWLFIGGLVAQSNIGAMLNSGYLEGYENYLLESAGGSFGLGGLFRIFLALFCVSQTTRLSSEKSLLCVFLLMYIFLFPLTNAIHLANRLNLYLEAIGIISIPIAMKANENKWINVLVFLILVIFNWSMYIGFFNSPSFHDSYEVYHTIFEAPVWQ